MQKRFEIYWKNMDLCEKVGAYLALVHLTVCLPDICAALESEDARTTGQRYAEWCEKYLPDPELTGWERYYMRCRVLHEGRTKIQSDRYTGFSFAEPGPHGETDHKRLIAEHGTFVLMSQR